MPDEQPKWVSVSDCMADLNGFIDGLAHNDRLDIDLPHGTLQVSRSGHEYEARLYGNGGGFCWSREWSINRIERFVNGKTNDPEVMKRENV